MRKLPARAPRIEPNTLGGSNPGTHIADTEPSGARRAETSPSLRKPWSPIGTARACPIASVRASAGSAGAIPAGSTGPHLWRKGQWARSAGREAFDRRASGETERGQHTGQVRDLEHGHPVDRSAPRLATPVAD